ncbi:MAG: chemotaxis protein CheX, partial [Desulfobulbaceae bacterium]|nr:chemotaxis protein CheX [Desulfobulbaceae bacterium]
MEDIVKQAVGAALAEVFERMFFTLLEPLEGIPPREEWSAEEEFVEASIAYAGQINGALRFFFPRGLARAITDNFLGGDESEVSDGRVLDTVREAVNMAVGSMLGRIDPEGHCTLGIPEARLVGDFSAESVIADLGLYVFNSNFGHLWVI